MDIQDKLDGDVPYDVPQWIVEYHWESDERELTPIEAIKQAIRDIHSGHRWMVYHVRSGLAWSVNLERKEEVEVINEKRKRSDDKPA